MKKEDNKTWRPDPAWKAFHSAFDPDDPDDGRVICWYCQHWTHNLELPVWRDHVDGRMVFDYAPVRCCEKTGAEGRLGHDPLIPRRCDLYKPRAPQYRVRLPDGAFPRGWRALDGAPPRKRKQ